MRELTSYTSDLQKRNEMAEKSKVITNFFSAYFFRSSCGCLIKKIKWITRGQNRESLLLAAVVRMKIP